MDLGKEKTESTEQEKAIPKKFSRRGFLKTSVGMGVGAAGAALLGYDGGMANAAEVVQHDSFPVEISSDYKRYNQAGIVPIMLTSPGGQKYFGKRMGMIPQEGGEGWGPLEEAFDNACWAIEDDVNHSKATAGIQKQGLFSWEGKVNPEVYKFESPEAATAAIKKAATYFGASKVGIAPYDDRWVYTEVFNPDTVAPTIPNEFPFTPTHVIVMAFEMDYDGYQTAPTLIQTASSANIYSNMGVTSIKLAKFIRNLGYKVIPCCNDTALSVPLAVQAGLGELSRIGILITPEFGPRVRLCKMYVDMPLAIDKPITFGAMEFCKTCMKCADACPSQAISNDKEPSYKVLPATNPGVKKWAADGLKCVTQWGEVGGDCGICIKVCPYNKKQEWHHDLAKFATRTPARPVLRFFDDLFGYGKITVSDALKKFWNK